MDLQPTINDQRPTTNDFHPWPHRLSWKVACCVFPLIWMGGLVTTKGAGMAVPDWPTTYESWFYPIQKWIWKTSTDLFLEHGHRTLAQYVGLVSIFLLVAVFRCDGRKSARWLAIIILGGLLFQGTLGGFRVLWDERLLARIHGCTAPIVFCLCAAMVTITSKEWKLTPYRAPTEGWSGDELDVNSVCRQIFWLTPFLSGVIYLEIVFGTLLRHPLHDAWSNWSLLWIWSKVITAGVLFVGLIYLLFLFSSLQRRYSDAPHTGLARTPSSNPPSTDFASVTILRRLCIFLVSLFLLQVTLACITWVANYGWPKWFTENFINLNYTVVRGGILQVWLTTAHAAVGSLVLVSAVNLTIWSGRFLFSRKS